MKKLQTLDFMVKGKIIQYFVKLIRHEHHARVYEWIKGKKEEKGEEFKSEDALHYHVSMYNAMNKFLFKGVDNSILDIEYKKEQKALEKQQKSENKHGDGSHAPKGRVGSPGKKPASGIKKSEGSKHSAKNKFSYKPLEEYYLEMPVPPRLEFHPLKQEVQMIIKKASNLKSEEDIDMDPMGTSQTIE